MSYQSDAMVLEVTTTMMAIAQTNMRMILLFQVNFFRHGYKKYNFFQEYFKNTHFCKKLTSSP